MILINLLCCWEKVLNIWMIGKFNETRLPGKENFYSTLNMEDVADSEYNHEE